MLKLTINFSGCKCTGTIDNLLELLGFGGYMEMYEDGEEYMSEEQRKQLLEYINTHDLK